MENQKQNMNPLTWDYGSWRKFFFVAAAWNLIGAVPALVSPRLNLRLFYAVITDNYITLFLNRGLWWAILVFGIGYLIIASDPGKHLGIVIMGIIGKTIVAGHWLYLFSIDRATALAVFAVLGDSIFTLFFLLYLIQGPRSREKE
ncbi:MAG: hypothetical protein JSU92_13550 [Deltaproteobacteria bacterium]|nr:MAG: hypothetical protein JSU92_13550 [Deltaproteobacteria bacterium]